MRKILFLIATALISLICVSVCAQSTTLSSLTSSKWRLVTNQNSTIIGCIEFNKNELRTIVVSEDITLKNKAKYYLSDKVETVFNPSNVGKIDNGKYIIYWRESDPANVVRVFELQFTEKNKLTLIPINSKSSNANTYIAIPK